MKKIFSLLLAGAFLLGFGAACDGENTDKKSAESQTLLGFESVRELLSFYRISIAETTLNTDKTYVTEGDASMKISYHYDVEENKFAKDMVLGFVPGMGYFDKETATDIAYYAIDVYNPNGREYVAYVNVGGATLNEYVLQSGWNTLYTYVDRTALYQVQQEAFGYYSLTFRGQKGAKADFYVDNWRYYATEEEFEKYVFDNSLKNSKTWHNFTSTAETKYLEKDGTTESQFSAPRFTINRDTRYVQTGNSSMKISFYAKKNGTMDCTSFKTVDKTLPNFNEYANGEGWYIFGNIYNDFDNDIVVTYTLKSTESAGYETFSVKVNIPAKSWSNSAEARIYLDDVEKQFTGNGISGLCLKYEVSGVQTEGCIYLDSIGLAKD